MSMPFLRTSRVFSFIPKLNYIWFFHSRKRMKKKVYFFNFMRYINNRIINIHIGDQMATEAELRLKACKFEYEYLGKSVTSLAQAYNYAEALLANEIQVQGWYRKCIHSETILPSPSNIKEYAVALGEQTRQQLNIIALFRQIENLPLIAQLENACISKALEIANDIDAKDSSAAARLTSLVKAIQMLQENNPINVADKAVEDGLIDSGITVNILNQIQ